MKSGEKWSNMAALLQKYTVNYHNQHFYLCRFGLYQRPSSEEVWSILLPVLATVVMGCGKKSVVRVAQRVAALVPVQGLSSLFSNVHCLFDPSCAFVWFSVQKSIWAEQTSTDWPCIAWKPRDQLVGRYYFGQRIRQKHKMDQRGSARSKRGTTILEPGRGQPHAEPHVRPISCHIPSLLWQEPEKELIILLLIKVSDRDRNVKGKNVGCDS